MCIRRKNQAKAEKKCAIILQTQTFRKTMLFYDHMFAPKSVAAAAGSAGNSPELVGKFHSLIASLN